jgi:hypothetical protein
MLPGLSPYHFGFNNPVRYSDPLGLMGQDPGIWGTGDTYASNNSQNPFDFMPKFTRTNPGSGNHWSDDNIPGNPNDQAIRDYYLLSGSEFEKKYGAHQSHTVIIAGSLYIVSNTTKWIEYDGVANEKSYTYETTFTKAGTSGGSPSVSDLTLAGVGTLGYVGERLSQNILNSHSGYSSGKMFPGSPANYSKSAAKNVKTGFKVGGWALTLYGIYDTETQYRAGQIDLGRRQLNHLNNGTGVLFPIVAIPIAAGDYLGQTYSDEIYNTTAQPGGFVFEATKWMLESLGIPTGPK